MPYYNSILTRYKANASDTDNRSYTATNDNIADLVSGDSDLSFATNTNNKEIIVGGDVVWSGSSDLIAFDRVFRFNTTSSKFYGASGNSGVHAYFVNCTFRIQALISQNEGGTRTPVIGHSPGDWNTTRAVDIPTNELGTGQSGWHFYNCKFIFEVGGNDSTAFLTGDMYDCTMLQTVPNMMDFVFYPMGNSVIRNFYSDCSAIDQSGNGNYSGYAFQFSREVSEISGLNLQNQYLYPIGNALDFEFPLLSAEQNQLYSASNSGTPSNPPVIRFGEFSSLISSATLASPKVDLRGNGHIFWRNARTLSEGGDQCRAIASRRFERNVFSDTNQTEHRSHVKYSFETNVNYETAGNGRSIEVASSDSTRTYVTDSTGIPQGTYNFVNGASSADDEAYPAIDIPISYFTADTGSDVTDDFQTLQFDFTTNLEVVSLFGQTNTTATFSASDWAADQDAADADDGFWIPHDVENTVDLDDEYFIYASPDAIMNIADDDGTEGGATISANDVYGMYKYAVYEKDIAIADFPYSSVSDGKFDLTSLGVNNVTVSSASGDNPYSIDDDEISIHCAGLSSKSTDTITKIKATNVDLNSTALGIDVEATISNPNRFASLPSDVETNYTAKDATLSGTLSLPNSGTDGIYVFNDCTFESLTVQRSGDVSRDDVLYLVGTTSRNGLTVSSDNSNNGDISVLAQLTIVVNFTTEVDSDDKIYTAFFESSDGSTFVTPGVTPTVTRAADGMSATIDVELDITSSADTELYYAISADGHALISGNTNESITLDPESIPTANLNFDESGFNSEETALLGGSITFSSITSNTSNIVATNSYTTASVTARDSAARLYLRKIQDQQDWLNAVARNYIDDDFFTFNENQVVIKNQTQADRLNITRSDSAFLWFLNCRVELPTGTSLFTELSGSTPGTYIQFSPSPSGASVVEVRGVVQEISDDQLDDIRGSDNRTVTETYNQAKGAKNAAFAS